MRARYNPRSGWEYQVAEDGTWWSQAHVERLQAERHGCRDAASCRVCARERVAAKRTARAQLEVRA